MDWMKPRGQVGWGGRARGTIALVGAASLVALGGPAHAVVVNRIVATVDGRPITQHQVEAFVRANGGTDPALLADADRRKALDALINDMLVEMESQAAGVSTSNEEVEAYIEQIKKRNNLSDERLLEALEAQGLTMERYREQVRTELQRSALVSKQIRARVNITPEEIERYYKEHPDDFALAESVRVEHIFFPFRQGMDQADAEVIVAEAKLAYDRLNAGEPFATVAREAVSGPAKAVTGDLGTMRRGQMVPELETVAFRLKEGEVSPPTQGPGGLHILRVTERASSSSASLDEVREQIKEKLYAAALEQRYQRWVEEDLRKSHEIVIR
jgi:peptidyl-prolyl cis-trans isomerase SurA